MQLACCIVGTGLLILVIVISAFSENNVIWLVLLILGEIVAFFGYAPVLLGVNYSATKLPEHLKSGGIPSFFRVRP